MIIPFVSAIAFNICRWRAGKPIAIPSAAVPLFTTGSAWSFPSANARTSGAQPSA